MTTPKNKGGRKPGPNWTPASRLFVELMKKGETQTEAARQAWPRNKRPDVQAARAKRSPLVKEAMEVHEANRILRDQKAAEAQGKKYGELVAEQQFDARKRAAELAMLSHLDTGGNITGQVKATELVARIDGLIVEKREELTRRIAGKTDEEKKFIVKYGNEPTAEDLLAEREGRYSPAVTIQ